MKNKKVLNKKIKTEIGVGIVLLVAILIGGAFYLQSKEEQSVAVAPAIKQPEVKNKDAYQQPNQSRVENGQNQTQQQDQAIGDIKKHTNSKYGFEFEYPANLVVTSTSTDDVFGLSDRSDGHWAYNITVSANVNNMSLGQAFDSALERYKNTDKKIVITSINIGGEQAKRYSIQNPTDSGNSIVVLIHGKNIITIYGDDSTPYNKAAFAKLLASFKFIK